MPLEVRFEQSHRYSFVSPVKAAFRVTIVPVSGKVPVKGLHYIVLLDASGSMKKAGKMDAAKRAVERLVESMPPGNYVTLIAFGLGGLFAKELVVHRDVGEARDEIIAAVRSIIPDDGTPLYRALVKAIEIANAYPEPGYIVVVTDGRPTDKSDPEEYRRLKWPRKMKAYAIGVGLDYNKELLALIADMGNGYMEHVGEAEVEKLVEAFEETAAPEAYAKDFELTVEPIEGEARLLGYDELTITIPVLRDESLEIYGEVTIPANHRGEVARVHVSYEDPVTGKRETHSFSYTVEPAPSREEYVKGINREVYDTYLYHAYLEEARRLLLRGDIDAATKRLVEAEKQAEKTKRIDLVVETKRLLETAEATKRLGSSEAEEATRRLLSEATKRIRK
ncbi:VWA domain-containing protein [Pyrofollis japonicus]|uniref:VWA domain-containing protein n=1 Tax=Pyrofollis japonicus TaxID=3060460 RepID=UPI00295B32F9|nr:VWA domain-containing protein [Pyrofollis japonicus]BEP16857.1 VWA domain-containing protein [Pyrofollis japonicus]